MQLNVSYFSPFFVLSLELLAYLEWEGGGDGGGDEMGEGYKHFDSRVFGKSVMIDQVGIYCRREYNFGKITSLPIGSWE